MIEADSAGSASFFAIRSVRARRIASACALPRPSAIASAKLANSSVNHSHADDAEDEPRPAPRRVRPAPDAQHGGEDAADQDHEHHRVPDLLARIELEERIQRRPAHDRRVEQRALALVLAHERAPIIARCSTIGPSARAGKNVSAPTTSTVAISSTTNSGVWVGSVPAPAGTCFLAASEPAIASAGIGQPEPGEEHRHAQRAVVPDRVRPQAGERAAVVVARPTRRRRAPR